MVAKALAKMASYLIEIIQVVCLTGVEQAQLVKLNI